MKSEVQERPSLLVILVFAVLVAFQIVLVVNAWGHQGPSAWCPSIVAAGIMVALAVGARLKVSKDGFELDTRRRAAAKTELRKATESKGEGRKPDPTAEGRIDSLDRVRGRDVLWVDDHPERIVHETMMLLHLGHRVITAVSTEDAEVFLHGMRFDVVVTDLKRGADPSAGITLIERVRKLLGDSAPPVIVYTYGHEREQETAHQHGASAVVETPDALLEEVLKITTW